MSLRQDAWIGDAVLLLYARMRILREGGELDGSKCIRMTSNHFLSTVGEPTGIEAQLGRVFQNQGLDAAFQWIEDRLMPVFDKQEANRLRKGR